MVKNLSINVERGNIAGLRSTLVGVYSKKQGPTIANYPKNAIKKPILKTLKILKNDDLNLAPKSNSSKNNNYTFPNI